MAAANLRRSPSSNPIRDAPASHHPRVTSLHPVTLTYSPPRCKHRATFAHGPAPSIADPVANAAGPTVHERRRRETSAALSFGTRGLARV